MPDIMEDLIKRIADLEQRIQSLAVQRKRFDIFNPNTPAQLTANVNDYDVGEYDILFMNSDASRNVSGMAGGVEGRRLQVSVNGSFNIVFLNGSGLSVAANRISTPTGASIALTPGGAAYFVYTGSLWSMLFYTL